MGRGGFAGASASAVASAEARARFGMRARLLRVSEGWTKGRLGWGELGLLQQRLALSLSVARWGVGVGINVVL